MSPFTVEARAARWQRRYVGMSIEWIRMFVAVHDLERELVAAFRPLLRRLVRILPA